VVWKSGGEDEFSVMRDVCSHRQAPLSEGRVDPLTKCLECPYHGVQFDSKGSCTKIPQMEAGVAIPKAADVASFPTRLTGDMLWARLDLPGQQYPTPPDDLFPVLLSATRFTTRDLPYSLDYLLENFMDPAHIPFAHHSLQGVRSDGSPIPMTPLEASPGKVEVGYSDVIRGKPREGVVSFVPPLYYHFRARRGGAEAGAAAGAMRMMLLALCVPVRPGWSRIHLALAPGAKLPIPRWLLHRFSNDFLDTDLWLHDQERVGRGLGGNSLLQGQQHADKSPSLGDYVMPTSSDVGVKSWRRWWGEHMQRHPIFGEQPSASLPLVPKEQQLDRWQAHAVHCSACRGALRKARAARRALPFAALALAAAAASVWARVVVVVAAALFDYALAWVERGVLGPERGERASAARLP
jgi:nitrite reductase/ring-hydroxylating ferredoxin subunit